MFARLAQKILQAGNLSCEGLASMRQSAFRVAEPCCRQRRTLQVLLQKRQPFELPTRAFHKTTSLLDVPSWPPNPIPQSPVGPSADLTPASSSSTQSSPGQSFWRAWASSASFQAALTTIIGLGMVFGAGVGYLEWYKAHVLHRVGIVSII